MPDQSNGQRLWALVHRGPQASAILFPRCLKRSILRLKSKITSFFSVFTKACLSGRWEIVPWRWSVAVKCPEGGSRCFGRLKRKHSLDYIHARLHKVCKSSQRFFNIFNGHCLLTAPTSTVVCGVWLPTVVEVNWAWPPPGTWTAQKKVSFL